MGQFSETGYLLLGILALSGIVFLAWYLIFRWPSHFKLNSTPLEKMDMAESQVTGFGSPDEWQSFIERHKLYFDRFSNLKRTLEATFLRELSASEPVDRIVFYLGRLCVEDFMEIQLLCGNGYGIGGLKLLRGMYERAVTASYLHLNPDEAEAFLDFYWVAQRKEIQALKLTFGKDVLPSDKVKESEENFERVRGNFEITDCKKCGTTRLNHTWSKLDFVSMAYQVGDLGQFIVPAYYFPTRQAHSTVGALLTRLEQEGDTITFRDGAQREEADSTFQIAQLVLLNLLKLQQDHFKLDSIDNQLEQCFQDYLDIWGEQPNPISE